MRLGKIIQSLDLIRLTPELGAREEVEVQKGHAADLLSDVLANASPGGILVTAQVLMNVLAVALHADLAGLVFSFGRVPEEPVRKKAVEIGMPLFSSPLSTFDLVGKLYALGLRGAESTR